MGTSYLACCPAGHRYRGGRKPPTHCNDCGKEYVYHCDKCEQALYEASYSSHPMDGPPGGPRSPPKYCGQCGHRAPWHHWYTPIGSGMKSVAARAWTGFTKMRNGQLIVVVLVVLIVVGALSLREIVELIKSWRGP